MTKRRTFLYKSLALATGTFMLPSFVDSAQKIKNIGIQLYTFREAMMADAIGTLEQIASLGFNRIETARSDKGHYYGLTPEQMKSTCKGLGMQLTSGHVHLDDKWQQTMEEAVSSGQEYVICSTMPTRGQTGDNYKAVAEVFNKAGEECKKLNLKFGYHNHAYEFESENGHVLYDVLLDNTDPGLVHMELDLGWVIVGGKDPLDYFEKYSGRFPLWHLKDMDMTEKQSTEFGKGGLDILAMLRHKKASGVKHIFVEQEEYASTPYESMKYNMGYLETLKI